MSGEGIQDPGVVGENQGYKMLEDPDQLVECDRSQDVLVAPREDQDQTVEFEVHRNLAMFLASPDLLLDLKSGSG